jgi:hypothetical protein
VSTQQGMVTQLESIGNGLGPGERYILRYHRTTPTSSVPLDVSVPKTASASWPGLCYRNNEISMLLLRQG